MKKFIQKLLRYLIIIFLPSGIFIAYKIGNNNGYSTGYRHGINAAAYGVVTWEKEIQAENVPINDFVWLYTYRLEYIIDYALQSNTDYWYYADYYVKNWHPPLLAPLIYIEEGRRGVTVDDCVKSAVVRH